MENRDYLNHLLGAGNHQQEKETKLYAYVYPYADMLEQFRAAHPRNRKDAPGYITDRILNIQPVELVQSLEYLSPEMRALFLKVLADHELWTAFRQRAAEAVCKEDKDYFLTVQSFPFCFAYAKGNDLMFYTSRSKWFHLILIDYTFDDLAVIAEGVINDNEKNRREAELIRRKED